MSKRLFVAALKETELGEGKMRGVRVRGKAILLARVESKFYAVSNRCPHAGCQLQGGVLNGYIVVCPCHGWKFDIRNGAYQTIPEVKLDCYPSKAENGKILVEVPAAKLF